MGLFHATDTGSIVHARICRSESERDEFLRNLKIAPCPHCKMAGTLNRHGFVRGFQQGDVKNTTIRARRVFCGNRNRAGGCGRTFSVWIADKVKRLYLRTDQLWRFLQGAVGTNNKLQAFRELDCHMGESAPYRIWRRFRKAQTAIRIALAAVCSSPKSTPQDDSPATNDQPAKATLDHLAEAFAGHDLNPVAAFQVTFQTFVI